MRGRTGPVRRQGTSAAIAVLGVALGSFALTASPWQTPAVAAAFAAPGGVVATRAAGVAPALGPTVLHHARLCAAAHRAGSRAGKVVVAVVVEIGADTPDVTCVAVGSGTSGSQVLVDRAHELGRPVPSYNESGLLCSVDGYPGTGCGTRSGDHFAYWAYFHGGASWTYANVGPAEWPVSAGDVEGWRFEPDGSGTPADPPPRSSSVWNDLCGTPPTTTTTETTSSTPGYGGSTGHQASSAGSSPSGGGPDAPSSTPAGTTPATTARPSTSSRPASSTTTRPPSLAAAGSGSSGASPGGAPPTTGLAVRDTAAGSGGAVIAVVVVLVLIVALVVGAWFRRRHLVRDG
jgi:hypothetical protein